jgi:hypothetical protein
MKLATLYVLGTALAVLVGSCTGLAAHEAERAMKRCAGVWDVQQAPPVCVHLFDR